MALSIGRLRRSLARFISWNPKVLSEMIMPTLKKLLPAICGQNQLLYPASVNERELDDRNHYTRMRAKLEKLKNRVASVKLIDIGRVLASAACMASSCAD